MKFHLTILVYLLLICSCTRTTTSYTEDISKFTTIHAPQKIKDLQFVKYSDVFDSVKIIKLESTKSSLIGRIDKVLYYDSKIFILDQTERKAVFEFDANGKFIRQFGSVGNGPGKYNEPNDISVNKKELAIWVSDLEKFVIYDLDGRFLREVKTASFGKSGAMLDDNKFAVYLDIGADVASGEKFNLKVINDQGEVTHVAFEKKDKDFSKGSFFFSQNENQFIISPGYSNNIYALGNNAVTKKFAVDFGQYQMPADFSQKFPTAIKFQQALSRSNYAYLSKYWDTPGYLVFSFVYKGMLFDAYYSKRTKVLKFGNAWFNNVHGILSGVNKGAYADNIIAIYDPAHVDSYQKTYKSPPSKNQIDTLVSGANRFFRTGGNEGKFVASDFSYSKEEIDLLHSIKTSDNPVILIQKLKKF
ncbi:6-bladed beta-propeller [Mucilaginibacter sp.]|uniref:6-bladed beta-propeller n=1 Tax=Mucilaginibacter sp. TaxID=1882438 RepID=UPI002ECFD88F